MQNWKKFPVSSQMFIGSTPSDFDILSARALLEIRSIIVKHPKRKTSLLPYAWARRYGHVIGPYEAFVKSHMADIFIFQISEFTGLFTVELKEEFSNKGYLALHQLVLKSKAPPESMLPVSEDSQYVALCSVRDKEKQASICGGIEYLNKAVDKLAIVLKHNPMGCTIDKARQQLSEAGILPIPLEWFDSMLVVTSNSQVYLRKCAIKVQYETSNIVSSKIEGYLENSFNKSASFDELNAICQLPPGELLRAIKGCPRVFFEPDKIFPCAYFQETVIGYHSPAQLEELRLSKELAVMSPIRHLLRSIEVVLDRLPSKRIPTEYILAWCAALDFKPRMIWQCLQDKVFWSASVSNHQVILRTSLGKTRHPDPSQDAILPRDVVAEIVSEVKRLGNKCTLDKLVANIQWGKGSLYRKMYGSLAALLPNISSIFYEPAYMYDRKVINDDVVWPELDLVDTDALVSRYESDWQNLANFGASMLYYLTNSGLQTYPLQGCLNSIVQFGFVLADVLRLSHLFVPTEVVYLRRSQSESDEIHFPESSVEFAVVYALRQSPLKALDLERLMKELIRSGRFSIATMDSLRTILISGCDDLSTTNADISKYCYCNPSIVTLRSYACHYLFIDPAPTDSASVASFIPQIKQKHMPEDEEEDEEQVEVVIPKWCIENVIVNIEGDDKQWYIKSIGNNGSILLTNMLDEAILQTDDVPIEKISPRPLRAGDKVHIMEGPWAGHFGQLVGISKLEGSVQMSKFDYKSILLSSLLPIR